MSTVSITIQKRTIFIPIVNIFPLFCTLYNAVCLRVPTGVTLRIFPYLLVYALPSAFFWMILSKVVPVLSVLCTIGTSYITPMIMAHGLIKYQKKYLGL